MPHVRIPWDAHEMPLILAKTYPQKTLVNISLVFMGCQNMSPKRLKLVSVNCVLGVEIFGIRRDSKHVSPGCFPAPGDAEQALYNDTRIYIYIPLVLASWVPICKHLPAQPVTPESVVGHASD